MKSIIPPFKCDTASPTQACMNKHTIQKEAGDEIFTHLKGRQYKKDQSGET